MSEKIRIPYKKYDRIIMRAYDTGAHFRFLFIYFETKV